MRDIQFPCISTDGQIITFSGGWWVLWAKLLRLVVNLLEDVAAAAVHLQVVVVVLPQRFAMRNREQGYTHLRRKRGKLVYIWQRYKYKGLVVEYEKNWMK